MRTNVAANHTPRPRTAEGAPARRISPLRQLERLVMSTLLWEDGFYVDGKTIAEAIMETAALVPAEAVRDVAIRARTEGNLRHVPLLLACAIAPRGGPVVAETVAGVVRRADEPGELISLYRSLGGKTVPKQFRLGLARALERFDEYQLSKYEGKSAAISLRDVLRIVHPKASSAEREALYGRVIRGELSPAETWERALSENGEAKTDEDKREAFERLLREGKLGYLALLRNLRGMEAAGVNRELVREAILARRGAGNVLPFRYVAAARACPSMEGVLDQALCEAINGGAPLPGRTIVLVDVSGSMKKPLSQKSGLTRMDAAAALASVIHSDDLRVFSFSDNVVEVPARRGMAGVDAAIRSQPHGKTYLGKAVQMVNNIGHDRLIVITDEQSHDPVPDPVARNAYMINVASDKNGVGYGKWTHIDGFSESVLRFIAASEGFDDER